jgi:hypothetical protein
MTLKELLAGGVAATTLFAVGCGEKKTEVPTNLSQPLPPPPVGSGGGKAAGKAGTQGQKAGPGPTGVAD